MKNTRQIYEEAELAAEKDARSNMFIPTMELRWNDGDLLQKFISLDRTKTEWREVPGNEITSKAVPHTIPVDDSKIAAYKHVLKLAGVPDLLIDHPELINRLPLSRHDYEWAKGEILKDQNKDEGK